MRNAIFLFIGLVLLTIGSGPVYFRVIKIKKGIVTEATVVRFDKITGSDNEALYKPIFRFKNYKNEAMIYTPSFADNSFSIGEKVKIVYLKDRYDNISILAYFKTFGIALFILCCALVSLFIAMAKYLTAHFFTTLKKPQPLT